MAELSEPAVIMPDTSWRRDPAIAAVIDALGSARFVGGCVRDALAGHDAKDIDLATPLLPDDVIKRLEAAGIKAVPTGIAHGTVTAVSAGVTVEITTLRRDVATDGRHAVIAYTKDWQDDAARRDFTINALYADPVSGAVFDWFGGVADLAAHAVRFIGDPLHRIAEDHLRILRFFRFHARFGGGTPDAASLAACAARANDLMALSRERIADELLKILSLPDPGSVITLMIARGIFAPVLPEIVDAAPLHRLVAREGAFGGDAIRRLASLLPADPRVAEDVGARLKLSNVQRKRMISAAGRSGGDATDPPALAYWITPAHAVDRLLLGDGDATALLGWIPPTFPLTGGAIVARGVHAGPAVARLLHAAERQWVSEGFPDKARAETIADAVVAAG
jgi:poly(A) polymerase